LGLLAGAIALVLAWLVGPRVGIVVTAGLVLSVAYSFPPLRLSARGFLTLLVLPLGYVVLPFLVGAYSVGSTLGPHGLVLLAGLSVVFVGRIALKDFRDVEGDAVYGKRTFLLRRGRANTCAFSALCWVLGSATLLTIVPLRSVLVVVFAGYVA